MIEAFDGASILVKSGWAEVVNANYGEDDFLVSRGHEATTIASLE